MQNFSLIGDVFKHYYNAKILPNKIEIYPALRLFFKVKGLVWLILIVANVGLLWLLEASASFSLLWFIVAYTGSVWFIVV